MAGYIAIKDQAGVDYLPIDGDSGFFRVMATLLSNGAQGIGALLGTGLVSMEGNTHKVVTFNTVDNKVELYRGTPDVLGDQVIVSWTVDEFMDKYGKGLTK